MLSVYEHYGVVLRDLEERRRSLRELIDSLAEQRDALSAELAELNSLVQGMERYSVPPAKPQIPRKMLNEQLIVAPFSGIPMRWACLKMLATGKRGSVTTGRIGTELIGGGYPKTNHFSSKLSAILGQMASKGELERNKDGWDITESGIQEWNRIRVSDKYVNRNSDTATKDIDGETTSTAFYCDPIQVTVRSRKVITPWKRQSP